MTDTEIDIKEIKATLKAMQRDIDYLKNMQPIPQPFPSVTAASPDCGSPIYSLDYPLSLSAAKSLWPYMEHDFDEYCAKHGVTAWTPTDSENFYNEFVRNWRRLAI